MTDQERARKELLALINKLTAAHDDLTKVLSTSSVEWHAKRIRDLLDSYESTRECFREYLKAEETEEAEEVPAPQVTPEDRRLAEELILHHEPEERVDAIAKALAKARRM